ncbi:MAG: bifunctional diaminohydroxyphosphoribosylaminopyrimidine deaminase/5-amino-6-(5-phosphoribosylamino)uracil reductase RibD [Bacteroidetes bacterium]|nr:MAG: bifunctional diaminohydroxyphosphoribosylaminopyrimidine deaminase/5-amino-6-(5-phosphoribosylamino)uracil reductase RibD [Bacteroidota bacterium]
MPEYKDEIYMQRCLQLAKNGLGNTYPNPLVGSVIVHKGKIIGEGYHKKAGEPHAEVNAVNSVKNKELLKQSTLYVNLEPCAHQGRTPACSTMIVDLQIPRVVVGCRDSFEKVDGKGIDMMQKAGIDVSVGVLEKESRELNKRFFTFHEKKRPYIILKWAQTLDGFIDFERSPGTPIKPNWITDEYTRMLVHKWRTEEQAIMVATNTAEKDNPKLNVRDWAGNQPIRIVLDRTLRLKQNLHLFDGSQKTIVITEKHKETAKNADYIRIPFDEAFYENMFKELYKREIQSVFIEGGAQFLQNLIDINYWDEAREFIGDVRFFKGVKAPTTKMQANKKETVSGSKLFTYRNLKAQ